MSADTDQYFDTHCHFSQLHSIGVIPQPNIRTLSVSTSTNDWQAQLQIHSSQNLIAMGIHPWWAKDADKDDVAMLRDCIASGKVAAVGEIGLDYDHEHRDSIELQRNVFEQQLSMAKEFQLPVSIHCRKSLDDVYDCVEYYGSVGVMHGFSSSYQQAERFVSLGLKIGVGLMALNANAKKLHEVIRKIPLVSLVLETDLTAEDVQQNHRSQNEIIELSHCIAELKHCSAQKVAEVTYRNASELLEPGYKHD